MATKTANTRINTRSTNGAPSAPYENFIFVCHSEESFDHAQDKFRDEESAF